MEFKTYQKLLAGWTSTENLVNKMITRQLDESLRMVYTQGGNTVFERWDALEIFVNHKTDKLVESYMNEIRTLAQSKKESNFEYAGRANMIVFKLQQAGHPGNKAKAREAFE
ncbi:hypothetical protein HK101_011331 [Irineochytrium annulatum]|nr:hypothetical protein HK101_011331 [Irineochytrium annulatum]